MPWRSPLLRFQASLNTAYSKRLTFTPMCSLREPRAIICSCIIDTSHIHVGRRSFAVATFIFTFVKEKTKQYSRKRSDKPVAHATGFFTSVICDISGLWLLLVSLSVNAVQPERNRLGALSATHNTNQYKNGHLARVYTNRSKNMI